MHCFFAKVIRPGIFILICAVLVGCAVDMGPYPQSQSIEAAVQTVLAKQGYYQGPIDGTIGPTTSRAIRNYQRDHRLTPTGTINPALTASMGLTGPPSVSIGRYYAGYPAYYPWYAVPTYYVPPVIGVGWGAGYGGYWNRGWGGGGYGGYRGYGGGYGHGWCR
jgi:Putative peptidoglycan binding domain